jgi:predicted ATPase/class 3 adenylate cyclase
MAVSRKTVTVLFADLADSTGLGERLDAELVRGLLSRWFEEARCVVERHGGTVEKFIGDAVMAVFGVPQTHEDDALRAVRAADALRESLDRLNDELQREQGFRLVIRVGVNTGEVVTGGSDGTLVTGDAVNVAKRLEEAARGGEVLVGELTELLSRSAATFEPLGPLEAKGKSWPVPVWRLASVDQAAGAASPARFDTPLVGREDELAELRLAYARTLDSRDCHLFTLLGAAGLGKSRLASEFFGLVADEATALVGRCLPYGDGITFWPLTEILHQIGGDDAIGDALADADDANLVLERLAGVTGRSPVGSHETFWAIRRLFEALARQRPLVVCFEDVHWAEPTFLDLIEYLAGFVRDAPALLLCIARPELLEERPAWLAGGDGASAITLTPLSAAESDTLLDSLGVPVDARTRVAAAAEGNPLYVEQMAAMLAEGAYADDTFSIPPTIHALLTARLDRLTLDEQLTIASAAVCGKEFSRDAIVALTPADGRDRVFPSLMALVRKDLIRPHRSVRRPDDDAFLFSHVLVRDAAYETIPKQTRAHLHEAFANWIADTAGERALELEEIVGYHLEQAFKFHDQLGAVDDHARRLAARGGTLLGQAGHRAFARGDMPAAVTLLARAAALLPSDHPTRVMALPELGSALMRTGDFRRAEEVLTDALESASAAGDKRLELRTLIEREFFRSFTKPEGSTDELIHIAEQAIPLLEALGDELGLAKAWWLRSEADAIAGRWSARAERLERARLHAQRASDPRELSAITAMLVQALEYGPMPAADAIRRCEELRAESAGDGALEAAIASSLAQLTAMQGDFEAARRLYADAGELYDELGLHYLRACRRLVGARIQTLAGEPDAAIAELQTGYAALEEMGERGTRSTLAAFLAQALAEAGRFEEAEDFARISAETGALSDVVTQAVWRSASAQVLASDGELALAERHAREALELAESTDFLELQAMTSLALAGVLRETGKAGEAAALAADARQAYERKGNVVAAAQLSDPAKAR